MNENITIDTIGGNCPVQAEGWFKTEKGQHRFYFRARGTTVSCDVTRDPANGDPMALAEAEVWAWWFKYGFDFEAGWISEAFARGCIDEAYRLFDGGRDWRAEA